MITEMVIITFLRSLMMDSLDVPGAADKSPTRDLLFLSHSLNAVTVLFPQLPYLVAMSRPHEARSCRATCVLPLPAHWATSHEPLAGYRRCPSRPGPHPGARTRSRRLVVSSPLPAVARFCRARPLTARASSSRSTHGASRCLPSIRAGWQRRDARLPSRRGTTAAVYRHRLSRRPHRPSLAEPSRTAPLDNRSPGC